MLESLFNSFAGRIFFCKRLLLFVSPQNTITNSSGEFGLDETSAECKVSIFLKRTEAVARRCTVKKVFLQIPQNSKENTCVRVSFLIKLEATDLQLYLKKHWHRFYVGEHLWWLIKCSKINKSFFNISINILSKLKKVPLIFQLTFL